MKTRRHSQNIFVFFSDVLFYDVLFIPHEQHFVNLKRKGNYMGRKRLNRTQDELLGQQRLRAKRYYQRHKARLNAKSMQRYWGKRKAKVTT